MKRSPFYFLSAFSLSTLILTGCTQSRTPPATAASEQASPSPVGDIRTVAIAPVVSVATADCADPAPGQAVLCKTSVGGEITVQNHNGNLVFEAEATLSDAAFQKVLHYAGTLPSDQQDAAVDTEISRIMSELHQKAGAIEMSRRSQYGFLKFMLPFERNNILAAVRGITLAHEMLINPVISDKESLKQIKALSAAVNQGATQAHASPDSNTDGFSGLEQIHAPEFVKLAESQIGGGVKVNGDSVKIGITDTGITYNHPTFLSGDHKKVRITYLKDFSREGRVYFSKDAHFSATAKKDGSVDIQTEIIVTPILPSLPAGDQLLPVKANFLVSKELSAVLTQPNSPARVGLIDENNFQGDESKMDLMQDGKLTDKWFVIFVPGDATRKTADQIYVDFSGKGDFSHVTPLRDWNVTHDMIQIVNEKLGFDIRDDDKLPNQTGSALITVFSASIVGFDPGNHGSHVSGIAAGNKTIANDSNLTLARGVAPEAQIMVDRVCSNAAGCDATEAMMDMASNGAQVINMSLGGLTAFNDGYGVEETIVNRVSSIANTLFVIAAGNSGPARQTIGSPGAARLSVCVGASASAAMINRQYNWPATGSQVDPAHDVDFMLYFSSRGPTANGGFKPNLVAPGTELSSVQLNSAPHANGGMDVYWGTSMATPTITGAYALFLDAVQKHNAKNPTNPLSSDSLTLRRVLIESARVFDATTLDTSTGLTTQGEYTWADEGTGMIDLVSAWKKLIALRDAKIPTAVNDGNVPVELDYPFQVSEIAPNGIPYNGSRTDADAGAEFGAGIYLDYKGQEALRKVYIARNLPNPGVKNAADLSLKLKTTTDEFVLRTVIYGSNQPWVRAGVLDSPDCLNSPTNNLTVFGEGSQLEVDPSSGGVTARTIREGILNICIDREMLGGLNPGDHGALVSGYRTVNGKVSPVASFTVPIFVAVPQQVLAHSTGYEVNGTVASFGVVRNYVEVPKGTSVIQITLETEPLKLETTPRGDKIIPKTEQCSGVIFMGQKGDNTDVIPVPADQPDASNCQPNRTASTDAQRVFHFSQVNPHPGIWDMHVLGEYQYAHSKFKLRVDYVTATSSVKAIQGDLAALTGSLQWTMNEVSGKIQLDPNRSSYTLDGLKAKTTQWIAPQVPLDVKDSTGAVARTYDSDVKSVTLHIENSPGNDIDLFILECDPSSLDHNDPSCKLVGKSDSPTDNETVVITPKTGLAYIASVQPSTVLIQSPFDFVETRKYTPEKGTVSISGKRPAFNIAYQMPASSLATNPLFVSGKYVINGALTLVEGSGDTMDSIPVEISAKAK